MTRYYTDDPLADFERYDADRESAMALLPECAFCHDRVWNDREFQFDGHSFCSWTCLDSYIRKHYLEDFLDDYIAEDRQEYDSWLRGNGETDSHQCRIDFCDSDCFDGFSKYLTGA